MAPLQHDEFQRDYSLAATLAVFVAGVLWSLLALGGKHFGLLLLLVACWMAIRLAAERGRVRKDRVKAVVVATLSALLAVIVVLDLVQGGWL